MSFKKSFEYRLELIWSLSLTNPLRKGLSTDWSCIKHVASVAQVLYERAWLQTGAVLKHFPLQILYEQARLHIGAVLKHIPLQILYEKLWKGLITDWSWTQGLSFANPLRKSIEEARLQIGAVLKHFPLRVLEEKARLQTGTVLKHFPLRIF